MLANDLVRLLHRVGEGQITLLGEAEDVPIEVLAGLAQGRPFVAPRLQQWCRQCGLGVPLLETSQGVGKGPKQTAAVAPNSFAWPLLKSYLMCPVDVPRRRASPTFLAIL